MLENDCLYCEMSLSFNKEFPLVLFFKRVPLTKFSSCSKIQMGLYILTTSLEEN